MRRPVYEEPCWPQATPQNKSDNKKENTMTLTIPSGESCLDRLCLVIHTPVTIHLTNGVKLTGAITEVLTDGFILSRDGVSQVVFRHAAATVLPTDGNATVAS